jgi:hypothetical protein
MTQSKLTDSVAYKRVRDLIHDRAGGADLRGNAQEQDMALLEAWLAFSDELRAHEGTHCPEHTGPVCPDGKP